MIVSTSFFNDAQLFIIQHEISWGSDLYWVTLLYLPTKRQCLKKCFLVIRQSSITLRCPIDRLMHLTIFKNESSIGYNKFV